MHDGSFRARAPIGGGARWWLMGAVAFTFWPVLLGQPVLDDVPLLEPACPGARSGLAQLQTLSSPGGR